MGNYGEPWEDEPGLDEPLKTIRDAVPTSRHAAMLFEMVLDLLGREAVVATASGATRRTLFRRAGPHSDWIVPWPILELDTKGRLSQVYLIDAPPGTPTDPPPRPGKPPRLRGLGPGEIVVRDGPQRVTVTYGKDGRWGETARSKELDTLAGVVPVVAAKSARPVELVAEYVVSLDPARHGPGLVHLPVPVPGGALFVWTRGLQAIRTALFTGRVPWEARWVVADGYAGTALAWGATRDEALSTWQAEVEREQPRPPQPEDTAPPPVDAADGIPIIATMPRSDVPQPDPAPENTPAVLIPLKPRPRGAPPWGQWVRLLGAYGTTFHALLRRDPDGMTLVGDRVAVTLDLEDLDERLDAVSPFEPPELMARLRGRQPPLSWRVVTYSLIDDRSRTPGIVSVSGTQYVSTFDPGTLDGDALREMAVRQRPLP